MSDVDAQAFGIDGVQRVFHIDKSRQPTAFLGLGNHMQTERRLPAGFRAVNFDHAPTRDAAHAQGNIQAQRARWNDIDGHMRRIPQAHNRAIAKALGQVLQGGVQRLHPGFVIACETVGQPNIFLSLLFSLSHGACSWWDRG